MELNTIVDNEQTPKKLVFIADGALFFSLKFRLVFPHRKIAASFILLYAGNFDILNMLIYNHITID